MANRRMFSLKVVDSDAFLEMPQTSQLLYFHLSMRADDDGFVGNPRKITRMVGANEDDMKILLAKRFLLSFESGVVVVKHWRIHNYIQSDRYSETQYLDEKKTLEIKGNGAYTECIQDVSKLDAQVRGRLEVEVGKRKETKTAAAPQADVVRIIDAFREINPAASKFYANTTQRRACADLIEAHGLDRVLAVVSQTLPKTNRIAYVPTVTTPLQLHEKWPALEAAIHKLKGKSEVKRKVIIGL